MPSISISAALEQPRHLEERHRGEVAAEKFAKDRAQRRQRRHIGLAVAHVDVELDDVLHRAAGLMDDSVQVVEHLAHLRHQIARRDDNAIGIGGILASEEEQPPPVTRMPWLKPRGRASPPGLTISFGMHTSLLKRRRKMCRSDIIGWGNVMFLFVRRSTDMDWKLELVAIPVSDVDRAKRFYVEQAGFHA